MEQLMPTFRQARRPAQQRGVALFLSLIALVAMTIAAVALVRSVDSANVISGNLAFRQSTLNIADLGVETAVGSLPTITSTSLDSPYPAGCTTACQYYPTMAASTDSKGRPTSANVGGGVQTINWNTVPTVGAPPSGYTVRYVVDRLCQGPVPVTDVVNKCLSDTPITGGSKKGGATVFSASNTVYYRVTVRVTGPRSTESYVQAIVSL
jgi:Tfp pilus assembly protein PilX